MSLNIKCEREFISEGSPPGCPECGRRERKRAKHQSHDSFVCQDCFLERLEEVIDGLVLVNGGFKCPGCNWNIPDGDELGANHPDINDGATYCNDCFIQGIETFDSESEFRVN